MRLNINNVLIIQKSTRFRRLLLRFFSKNFPTAITTEYHPEQGLPHDRFSWKKFDLLILGYELGTTSNGLEWLRIFKTNIDFPTIIFITEKIDHAIALQAIKYGAHNYFSQDSVSIAQLKNAISHAMQKHASEVAITRTKSLTATRLFNRTHLYKRLDSIKDDSILALIHINDHHEIYYAMGLLAVDLLTVHLSENISIATQSIQTKNIEIVRVNDNTIAVIILGVKNIDVCTQFIKILLQAIKDQPFLYNKNKINYSISIGITQITKNAHGAKNSITHADIALRMAMDKEKNSYVVFGGDVKKISTTKKHLIKHIQYTIKKNLIRPFFQLIVNASEASQVLDEKIYILRTKITDTNGQLLEYEDIFSLLMEGNLIRDFDYCVIQYAMKKTMYIKEKTHEKISFLVTLSEATLVDETIITVIKKLIKHFKDTSLVSSLILDIRSQYFKKHKKNIIRIMKVLGGDYKIKFSLTDIQNLKPLDLKTLATRFDFIKVSLSEQLNPENKTANSNALVAIIQKAKTHGTLTIAYQLDDANSLTTAVQSGADFICGYIIQPPEESIKSIDVECI